MGRLKHGLTLPYFKLRVCRERAPSEKMACTSAWDTSQGVIIYCTYTNTFSHSKHTEMTVLYLHEHIQPQHTHRDYCTVRTRTHSATANTQRWLYCTYTNTFNHSTHTEMTVLYLHEHIQPQQTHRDDCTVLTRTHSATANTQRLLYCTYTNTFSHSRHTEMTVLYLHEHIQPQQTHRDDCTVRTRTHSATANTQRWLYCTYTNTFSHSKYTEMTVLYLHEHIQPQQIHRDDCTVLTRTHSATANTQRWLYCTYTNTFSHSKHTEMTVLYLHEHIQPQQTHRDDCTVLTRTHSATADT